MTGSSSTYFKVKWFLLSLARRCSCVFCACGNVLYKCSCFSILHFKLAGTAPVIHALAAHDHHGWCKAGITGANICPYALHIKKGGLRRLKYTGKV
jgi:hypothetical protein